MRVLVIGKGGREHALVWKLAQSPRVERVFCAPGNAGTAEDGVNVAVEPTDIDYLLKFAKKEAIGLTVVGPEEPLARGVVDAFQQAGLRTFGPARAGPCCRCNRRRTTRRRATATPAPTPAAWAPTARRRWQARPCSTASTPRCSCRPSTP